MKKIVLLGLALTLGCLFFFNRTSSGVASDWLANSAELPLTPSLRIEVKKQKNQGGTGATDNQGGGAGATEGGTPDTGGGEHACPPGYVVLDKPNKYGAFCEPKEGVCKKGLIGTPPDCKCPDGTLPLGTDDNPCVAKENCQFPGQVGNPPNCSCPNGTEFVGYKGCVKYNDKSDCQLLTADTVADLQPKMTDFTLSCQKKEGKVKGPEDSIRVEEGQKPMIQLCCVVRFYEK